MLNLRIILGKLNYYINFELKIWLWQLARFIPGFSGCLLRRAFFNQGYANKIMVWDGVTVEYIQNLSFGCNVSINRGCILNCGGGVDIGDNVLLGPRVIIYSQNHNYKCKNTLISEQGYTKAAVKIESDVWIAADVKVMPGVLISKGTVIAAGAVVTKNTEAYGVYAGVPAVKISERI